MKKLILPKLRQTYPFDCGAKALQSVLAYYGVFLREDKIMKIAKTNKNGTEVKGIIEVLKINHLKYIKKKMSVDDLNKYISKEIPVILVLQAWTDSKNVDWKNDWDDGHYVVAVGFMKNKILFEDPSSFLLTYLTTKELEDRWHDVSLHGKRYYNLGIAVIGKKRFNQNKIIHMD